MESPTIEAAGGVLWRGDPAAPEVALVHRPRYDDWSLPKGKLNTGEHPLTAALREIAEETGSTARPGRRLGSVRYLLPDGLKRVRYWACEATGGGFTPNREVDELWWAPVADALPRLDQDRDRDVLLRFSEDSRRTRALVLLRHASAGDRSRWAGRDADRPLDAWGREQAAGLAGLLSAYDVHRAAAADVTRCRETVTPFARAAGLPVAVLPATTAGLYEQEPAKALDQVTAMLEGPGGAVWCGQGEVIADLVPALRGALGADVADRRAAARAARQAGLGKGRVLVLHIDDRDQLVALERLPR